VSLAWTYIARIRALRQEAGPDDVKRASQRALPRPLAGATILTWSARTDLAWRQRSGRSQCWASYTFKQ